MELILDGSNILWRAHWVSKNVMREKIDQSFSEVHLFLNMLKGYMKMHPNSRIWVAWDKKLDRHIKNPRYNDHDEYKAGRECNTVYDNCDKLIEAMECIGINNFYPSHLEADDCIAWLTKQLSPCIIFSADNDLVQLVNETTCVYNINKKVLITLDNFESVVKVPKDLFTLHKAINGDKSDNIQGIPGYGFKRSLSLAEDFDNKPIKREIKERILSNLQLIDLVDNYYMDELELQRYNEQFDKLTDDNRNTKDLDAFANMLSEMKLHKHLEKINEWKQLLGDSDLAATLKALNLTK